MRKEKNIGRKILEMIPLLKKDIIKNNQNVLLTGLWGKSNEEEVNVLESFPGSDATYRILEVTHWKCSVHCIQLHRLTQKPDKDAY